MRVVLTYFKTEGGYRGHGGKKYSEGRYDTEQTTLGEIWNEVAKKLEEGTLPGLGKGARFIISIDVPDHPHRHPHLIIP